MLVGTADVLLKIEPFGTYFGCRLCASKETKCSGWILPCTMEQQKEKTIQT